MCIILSETPLLNYQKLCFYVLKQIASNALKQKTNQNQIN